jgi:general secretion pathway protein D
MNPDRLLPPPSPPPAAVGCRDRPASKPFRQAPRRLVLAALGALTLLAGCASDRMHHEGLSLIDEGRYEEGLAKLDAAVEAAPRQPDLRAARASQRNRVVATLLARAEQARVNGDSLVAIEQYKRVLAIEPNNARAHDGLRALDLQRLAGEAVKQAQAALRRGEIEAAEKQASAALALKPNFSEARALLREIELHRLRTADPLPQLRARAKRPVTIEFRDANLKMIFDSLARTTGLNFVIDKEVKPDLRATIFVRDAAVEDVVDLLLAQHQLEKKIVNDNTVLVFPATQQKLKDLQELTIRTFYVANLDVKQAQTLIKTMLKTRDVVIDEKLNVLTMRDTPDAIRLAEKLLAAQDLPDPEVMLEIEVLEVSRKRILDLGVQWPSVFTALAPDGGAVTLLNELKGVTASRTKINRSVEATANATDNDINTLASPVVRVRNREKARIHIGDKIPIVSATSTPSTQGPVVTESITYLDVGLKIEVEPTIHVNDEVGIKVALEVSNSTQRGVTGNGSTLVEVSTRTATTGLRLRDGETQILAGLLRNDYNASATKVPGVGDLPLIGYLFGRHNDTVAKTELILSIKPRIVRNLPAMTPLQLEYPSGTESTPRAMPIAMRAVAGEALAEAPVGAPAALVPPAAPATKAIPGQANAAVPAAAAPLALVWAPPAPLMPGESGEIALRLVASEPLASAAVQIGFDPTALRILAASEGDLLKQGDAATEFTSRVDEAAGRVFVGISRRDGSGARGEGTLLRLRVTALPTTEDEAPPAASLQLVSFTGQGPGQRMLAATPLPPLDLAETQ